MYDIIIIGGGTAGMTAALYCLRGEKSVLVLEKAGLGGQITASFNVENYPAVKSISGSEFSDSLSSQIKDLGADILFESAKDIIKNAEYFAVRTSENEYQCKSVIISVGSHPKGLGIDNEKDFVGHGVSYCALCDGAFFKNRTVAVIGGGNTAMHDVLYLSPICRKVYAVNRRDTFKGEKTLLLKLKKLDNAEIIYNSNVTEIIGEGKVSGLKLTDGKIIDADGVFIAVGSKPQTDIFKEFIELDRRGYILAGEDCKTSVLGVFAAGDCRSKNVRQLTTAVSDGSTAAAGAMEFIEKYN